MYERIWSCIVIHDMTSKKCAEEASALKGKAACLDSPLGPIPETVIRKLAIQAPCDLFTFTPLLRRFRRFARPDEGIDQTTGLQDRKQGGMIQTPPLCRARARTIGHPDVDIGREDGCACRWRRNQLRRTPGAALGNRSSSASAECMTEGRQ